MAVSNNLCGSQFFLTLKDNIDFLDGKHTPFGRVVMEEGLETLQKINEALVDQSNRPLRDIRIRHVIVLGAQFVFNELSAAHYDRGVYRRSLS